MRRRRLLACALLCLFALATGGAASADDVGARDPRDPWVDSPEGEEARRMTREERRRLRRERVNRRLEEFAPERRRALRRHFAGLSHEERQRVREHMRSLSPAERRDLRGKLLRFRSLRSGFVGTTLPA